MKNTTNILGIIFIILLTIFVFLIILFSTNGNKIQKEKANEKLNEEQVISLIKYVIANITSSESLENNISDNDMLAFALGFMQTSGEYNITYSDYDTVAAVSLTDIEQVVKYIFNKEINYNNVTYNIHDGFIDIITYIGSTDVEIYKLRTKEYNENTDEYKVYIDCLEPSPSQYSDLKSNSTVEYSEKDVIRTIIFKYKQIDGRNVLLSYKLELK